MLPFDYYIFRLFVTFWISLHLQYSFGILYKYIVAFGLPYSYLLCYSNAVIPKGFLYFMAFHSVYKIGIKYIYINIHKNKPVT